MPNLASGAPFFTIDNRPAAANILAELDKDPLIRKIHR
jgi:hypothetical protein